ncbi:proteasome regulatory particle lid subunit RPN8 KNAG_0J01940 [Huiozyma naganishii CBS 8797]|uniref:MPN domain-containing protein n=1 Tax=Huiozyma naganishii (strain ATCC MYA-139 / BCRC 22969 / CBS 8797 / KCTC 17520 / NBRC 10181 / NCYC 3082 / Yp74L-3) TaxID=1071383 RepID=J7RBL3_HUIN7|nr:hypothetical protein KNAG_0J01940 [Kazachstania naganishii CBS 8797]CCK72275.1 hypothetical protein KNAG_0J01940 [Kazachstania naganishii CBS 8797]
MECESVSVAPLVLLSVLDHFDRVVMGPHPPETRVVGVLLGEKVGGVASVKVTNSFAIPFEEDLATGVWFLDQNYIENMCEMFRKINASEQLVGWYHSGPKLRRSDMQINDLFRQYTANPLLAVIDVKQTGAGLPVECYAAVEQINDDGSATEKFFQHLPCEVRAEDAEEIGVEHLLRDERDQAAGPLSVRLTAQLHSLQNLQSRLARIVSYLDRIGPGGDLPANHAILGKLQDVFNLFPVLGDSTPLQHALTVETNDELMVVYAANLVRTIIAFQNLIDNKIQNKKLATATTTTTTTTSPPQTAST